MGVSCIIVKFNVYLIIIHQGGYPIVQLDLDKIPTVYKNVSHVKSSSHYIKLPLFPSL